jgi:hypothetical protein
MRSGRKREDRFVIEFVTAPEPNSKYQFPEFLVGRVNKEQYRRWLHRKAVAHCKRDRKRHPDRLIAIASYKVLIHDAVINSDGLDWYTGEELAWEQISTYDNEDSRAGRSKYKAGYALLPTVDHIPDGDSAYRFVICGWRTNDAKNDLSLSDFLSLCRRVIAKHGSE